ncbi:MAG: GHKL domain-containing protein [Clostridia bacterium]|nr:GHKL domain-containing protein [Clostridia bacterium]
MIKKMQRRFIRIALVSLAVAMVLAVLAVNVANWISVRNELGETLSLLADSASPSRDDVQGRHLTGKSRHVRNLLSESGWFCVSFSADLSQNNVNLFNISDLDEQAASDLALRALSQSGARTGFLQDYLFLIRDDSRGGQTVVFLNCETKLATVRALALISALACLGGILLAWLIASLASRRAIAPTIRNMEQQKQFITNASHELKTPLTVISTNMDLLQMEDPDNPWVKSTQKQTAQLRHLVEELVYLSRMEEENAPLTMENLPLSALLEEAAEPFQAMAEFQGKSMTAEAEAGLTLRGDRTSIQRLLSILLDNAVKYAPAEGIIQVRARGEGRYILLTVSNSVSQPLTGEQCRQLFDRFYRADLSRSKEKQNGFGIGLAIAAAIVEKHSGSISAAMEGGQLIFTCRLPKGGDHT